MDGFPRCGLSIREEVMRAYFDAFDLWNVNRRAGCSLLLQRRVGVYTRNWRREIGSSTDCTRISDIRNLLGWQEIALLMWQQGRLMRWWKRGLLRRQKEMLKRKKTLQWPMHKLCGLHREIRGLAVQKDWGTDDNRKLRLEIQWKVANVRTRMYKAGLIVKDS